jgi:hypothetical protein
MARGLVFVLTCRFDRIPNNLRGKGEATVTLCGRPAIPLGQAFDVGHCGCHPDQSPVELEPDDEHNSDRPAIFFTASRNALAVLH